MYASSTSPKLHLNRRCKTTVAFDYYRDGFMIYTCNDSRENGSERLRRSQWRWRHNFSSSGVTTMQEENDYNLRRRWWECEVETRHEDEMFVVRFVLPIVGRFRKHNGKWRLCTNCAIFVMSSWFGAFCSFRDEFVILTRVTIPTTIVWFGRVRHP